MTLKSAFPRKCVTAAPPRAARLRMGGARALRACFACAKGGPAVNECGLHLKDVWRNKRNFISPLLFPPASLW